MPEVRPYYSTDTPGTFFDKAQMIRNLDKLNSQLTEQVAQGPGIDSSYLYVGTAGSVFPWHVEDANFYSISYLHAGAPKVILVLLILQRFMFCLVSLLFTALLSTILQLIEYMMSSANRIK